MGPFPLEHSRGIAELSITLIGPGGGGKSTVAALLAERLALECFDLDRRFTDRAGDIGEYIRFGYAAYARAHVETYRRAQQDGTARRVVALSSGFMTYPQDIHPEYAGLRSDIEQSRTTFVLVPSLNCERCVAETVRRQLARPFARPAATEEAVIRERLPLYVGLAARKVETMQPIDAVVDEIVASIATR
jgi:shikimate kinase